MTTSVHKLRSDETEESASSWSWCGKICDEEGKEYHGLFVFDKAKGKISADFSDGSSSFATKASAASLAKEDDESLASFAADKRLGKVREILESLAETPTKIGSARLSKHCAEKNGHDQAKHPKTLALRVAAAWGLEFGLTDLHLDLACISLQKSSGNDQFLGAVFERLDNSRKALAALHERQERIEVELEDLEQAQMILKKMQAPAERDRRLQAFVDTLNAYKLLCKERASG